MYNLCLLLYNFYIIIVCQILSVWLLTESKSEVRKTSNGEKTQNYAFFSDFVFCSGDGRDHCDGLPIIPSSFVTVVNFVTVHPSRPYILCSNTIFIITWVSGLRLRHDSKCWKDNSQSYIMVVIYTCFNDVWLYVMKCIYNYVTYCTCLMMNMS